MSGLERRERDDEARSLAAGARFDPQLRAVPRSDFARDRKPEARAFALRLRSPVETLEDQRPFGFRNTRPVIVDGECRMQAVRLTDSDREPDPA